jgi:Alpha-L-arabinofuranosidase
LRDAVLAGLNLNIFHAYAERVQMSNIAQMVNVLQAMILTDKEKMLLTPTYHVFKMYIPFQDATSFPVSIKGDKGYGFGDKSIPNVSVSAAQDKNGNTWLALVNTNPHHASDVTVAAGQTFSSAEGHVLTSSATDAHNTFEKPNAIAPQAYSATAKGKKLVLTLPAKSVVVVQLQ